MGSFGAPRTSAESRPSGPISLLFYGIENYEKKSSQGNDMLPPSRTLEYKTYLGVFLCPERVRLIQP